MKRNPSWINLAKNELNKKRKIWWNPEFTDRFLDRIEKEWYEWKEPFDTDIAIHSYTDRYHRIHSQYTINRNWEIKSLKWEVMKYLFYPNKRWPRVRIQIEKVDKNWEHVFQEKEISVLKLMEKWFWKYFIWYKNKRENPRDYILVPKDWDYNNMRYDNLHYVNRNEYYPTKKKIIENFLKTNSELTNLQLSKIFKTTQHYISKIKKDLAERWELSEFQLYQDFQKEIWIEFSEESQKIYKILLESKWKLSNLEIANILRLDEIKKTKNKRIFTDKVVRIRKKLTDKWIIPRFNNDFESKKSETIAMIKDKINSWKTNKEIAEILWLKKEQIDNLARQIKKDSK